MLIPEQSSPQWIKDVWSKVIDEGHFDSLLKGAAMKHVFNYRTLNITLFMDLDDALEGVDRDSRVIMGRMNYIKSRQLARIGNAMSEKDNKFKKDSFTYDGYSIELDTKLHEYEIIIGKKK